MRKNDPVKIQKRLASAITSSESVAEETQVGIVTGGLGTVEQLENERKRILTTLATRALEKVSYERLVESLVKLTHDIQLLAGKPTEITREEILQAEENELSTAIRNLEARISSAEGQGTKVVASQAEVSEGESSEAVHSERED